MGVNVLSLINCSFFCVDIISVTNVLILPQISFNWIDFRIFFFDF